MAATNLLRRRFIWWQYRHIIQRLQNQTVTALAVADVPTAVNLLEEQLDLYKWPFQIDELLFQRRRRPKKSYVSQALLEALHSSSILLPHQRFYAGIAAIYVALEQDDQLCLQRLEPWLRIQADLARGSVPILPIASLRNREHPWKQRVSCRACLLQLALARADRDGIYCIAEADYHLLSNLNPKLIPADVLYRATTNLLRGLLPLTLDPTTCQRILLLLQDLRQELRRLRYVFSRYHSSEQHLSNLENLCCELTLVTRSQELFRPLSRLELMINTPAAKVVSGFNIWLQHELSLSKGRY